MTARVWPVDAVTGAPAYSGRALRQASVAPWAPGATPTRPLGARSGIRPGSYSAGVPLVTATSTTWTLKPHTGVIDAESAAEAGPYAYALDANATGSVTAANATYARVDIVWVRIDDPAESDGSSTPAVVPGYTAGTAGQSPSAPAAPARAMVIAQINVPASGGGSPTVTMVAPSLPTMLIPVRTDTERTALDVTGATTLTPVLAIQAGAIWINDGTGWRTLVRGDDVGPIAFTAAGGFPADGAFAPGWSPSANPTFTNPVTYARINGEVVLGGVVTNTSSFATPTEICRLPVGFRPNAVANGNGRRRFLVAYGGTGTGKIEVYGAGLVVADTGTGAGDTISLDGIRFRALG